MKNIKRMIITFWDGGSGQDLTEYALVAGLMGFGAFVSMFDLSAKVGAMFGAVCSDLIKWI